mgnify:CR=1 FL=1
MTERYLHEIRTNYLAVIELRAKIRADIAVIVEAGYQPPAFLQRLNSDLYQLSALLLQIWLRESQSGVIREPSDLLLELTDMRAT